MTRKLDIGIFFYIYIHKYTNNKLEQNTKTTKSIQVESTERNFVELYDIYVTYVCIEYVYVSRIQDIVILVRGFYDRCHNKLK